MRLTLNLQNLLPMFPLEVAAQLTADAGFDATDFYLGAMKDPACVFNTEKWHDSATECRDVFLSSGTPITQTHAPFSFKGWDDCATFEEFIYPTIVRSIKVSAVMGASCVVVHPLHYWRYKGHEQEIFERNMMFYRSLIPICRDYGIKVGIENMFQRDKLRGNYIIHDTCSDVEEFCRYIDTLNSEYMVACLDVGHVGLPSGHAEAWDFIRVLGRERLQALHIHDNDYTNDQHLIPYAGNIDWSQVTQALGQIDYSGDFTYECLFGRMFNQLNQAVISPLLKLTEQIGRHLIDQVEANRPGFR